MNKTHMEKRLNQLPTWLWTNSTTLPPIYKMVWEAVREDKVRSNGMQTELLVDTNKVFPLLLTSQLPTEVLGHIWNLANQKYAGQLTEQELYIVLALVAAAQASYTFNSLDVLHQLPFPPTPYLNIECLMNLQPVTQLNSATKYQSLNDNGEVNFIGSDGRYLVDIKGKGKLQPQGVISSDLNVQTTNIVPGKVSCFDNRSHGSSAAVWDLNNMFKDAKQSTRPQLDAKHLSVTDSCDDFTEFQSAPIPNIPSMPIWDTKQGSAIGSRLANHNLGVKKPIEKSKKNNINAKSVHGTIQTRIAPTSLNTPQTKDQQTVDCLPDIFPKCTIKNQSQTVILKDTVIRNNDPPRDYSENVKDHANMEVINITNDKDVISKLEWTEKAPSGIVEPTQQDLMNLQLVEDKYSALRALVQETTVSTEPDLNASCNNQSTDEFGDFVSAEQPATDTSVANTLDTENFSDIFTDFEFKTNNNNNTNTADFNLMPDISESFDNLKLEDTVEERSLDMGKAFQKEDAISINSIEFMNGASSNALTRSGSVPSLDLKSFLPSNAEDEQVADTTHQAEYWEWKQYMESCVLLLQIAANIFTNINSELVLHEVLNSAQGYNFLCNLAEVAAVCRRVNFSYKEMDINIIGFDELLMDIDRIWAEMEPFYANIPIVTELPAWPLHQGEAICCSLCLTVITSGRVVYNENNYHVTCANLWLNCVNSHLPVMRHPSFYTHTNVCPGNNHI